MHIYYVTTNKQYEDFIDKEHLHSYRQFLHLKNLYSDKKNIFNVIVLERNNPYSYYFFYKTIWGLDDIIIIEHDIYVSDKEVYLMAQIVHAESRGEPFEGKIAVASVILNRLSYPEFPKSIEGVIMQKNAFSCVSNGRIDIIPDENSYNAVLEAIKGTDPTGKAVFFYNPRTATSKWMKNISKKSIKKIGNHVFFKA